MTLIQACILGIIEGLTEFIPVSSTGHLILLGHALGLEGVAADSFDVFIQLGAILAVVLLYFKRFTGLLDFSSKAGPAGGFRGWPGIIKLGLACLPAFVLGFLLHDYIKQNLFSSPTVAAALLAGGLLMFFVEARATRNTRISALESLNFATCFGIGLFQCLSLWPGMSRSGATIIGAMLLGVERKAAAEFSFLVAVPVMIAATGYDMLKSYRFLSASDVPAFGAGILVSFVTAILAIRFFISVLNRYSLKPFAIYRILLGIVVLCLLGR